MRRRAWLVAVVITVGMLSDIAANLVPLPGSWRPFLWAAWPVLIVMAIVLIVLEVRRRGGEQPSSPPAQPPTVVPTTQSITASRPGSTAFGAMYGNVIHRPAHSTERDEESR